MARIKVVGYLDWEDIEEEHKDETDPTGLSEAGFLHYNDSLGLEDLEFTKELT